MKPLARSLVALVICLTLAVSPAPVRAQDSGPYVERAVLGRGMVRSVAWSPDGGAIAVGGALGVWLYAPDTQDIGRLQGHTKAIYDLAWSPDGAQLASASHDLTVRVWDRAALAERLMLEGHTDLVIAVAWSADGQTIASGGHDGIIRLWDASTGAPLATVEAGQGWITDLDFGPDGLLLSAGQDGSVRLWDASLAPLARFEAGDQRLVAARFSSDGAEALAASVDGVLQVWNVSTGELAREMTLANRAIEDAAWSPNGSMLAVTWRLGSGMGAAELFAAGLDNAFPIGHMAGNFGDRLSWSPESDQIALIGWDSMFSVWYALVCAPKSYRFEHTDWIESVGWHEDGFRLISYSGDGLARTWDPGTGVLLDKSPFAPIEPAREALRPDGARRAVVEVGGVAIYDEATGDVIARLPGAANAVAWSADGARLAVALRNGTIKVWIEAKT